MARRLVRESLHRLFWRFFIIAFFIVSAFYLFPGPQASEVTNLESITGKLRFVTPRNNQYFYLRTIISGQEVDVFVRGVNNTIIQQLQPLVGDEDVTLYGRMTPGNRRPSLVPNYVFVVESLTPPVNPVRCDGDGSRMDIAYVADNSPSMLEGNPNPASLAREFVSSSQAKLLSSGDQAALLTFSAPTGAAIPFTTSFNDVVTRMQQLEYRLRNSDINTGIRFASDYVPSERRYDQSGPLPGVVIILTNNTMTPSNNMFQAVREDYEQRNLRYFIVSLGSGNNALQTLASDGGGTYFNITEASQVIGTVNQLFSRINEPYAGCVTMELKGNKTITRPGGTMMLLYHIHNNSRYDLTNATITQTLPAGFITQDNAPQVTISVESLPAGITSIKQALVRRTRP